LKLGRVLGIANIENYVHHFKCYGQGIAASLGAFATHGAPHTPDLPIPMENV
jgi:hypothetical protein